eukprot:CAMPEP_0206476366 /NCGR_PEP_ID=MMETSP0324_2-20121206/34685_1 /ASSEMBLY_ACC=CAM_ASM_000836 /TAXON_ID=2866 /ORGANISM="Crypthecodinium cohnii, Strain Seligo" /LENGTH=256 /DNA_ID=CAMNT_0053952007 /DNA_START=82 /DNA_END=853 /DNA_ORIENTATION=-
MGNLVNTLAFPRPMIAKAYYERDLMVRDDFLWLTTSKNEKIPAVFVKCRGDAQRLTLLYSHGNAEDLGLHLPYIDALSRALDVNVFSYEYVGYSLGRFEGQDPSEEGCIRSVDAAWKYLTDEKGISPKSIVIFGRSIGTGPSVDLASRTVPGSRHSPLDVAGVLLQSPIESGGRVAFGKMVSWIGYYADIFRNYEKIGNITAPVAIMHGTADEVVHVRNGQNLHELLKTPYKPLWIPGHGHNDMPEEGASATQRAS